MLSSMSFGKYVERHSIVHKMDPRLKIFVFVLLMSMVFIDIGVTGPIILSVLAVSVILFSKVPLIIFWNATKPILIMGFFIVLLNIFVAKEGSVLFYMGGLSVHRGSFERSLEIFLRIIIMVQFTTTLTATTKQIDIAVSTSALLKPLKYIKVPVNEIGVMVSITLRFIPTLIDEAGIIMSSQSARGVDFKRGKLTEKVKSLVSLIVPLFVSALAKAEDLSNAMEARGYNPKAKRTKYRVLKIKWGDWIALFFFLSLLTFFICLATVSALKEVRYLDKYFETW